MKKPAIIFIILFAVMVILATPFIGAVKITPSAVSDFQMATSEGKIFYMIRLPRLIAGFSAGMALACCGLALQAMFRNPLATPFTLGISGGAAFGAAVYFLFFSAVKIFGAAIIFSFGGAFLAVGFVYGLTKMKKGFSVTTMLLAGVAVNFFFSSLILLLQYLSDFTQSFTIIHWLMGSCDVTGYSGPMAMFGFAVVGTIIIAVQSANLNLMSISDEIAVTRGVNIHSTRKVIFLTTSAMVAAVVAFCGPIGFVGLMSPHICRRLVGPDHKVLTPAAILFGGAFLGLCDCLARTLISPAQMPVGVITALLGGPFFLWLLISKSGPNEL